MNDIVTDIRIPDSVTYIGYSAFFSCTVLTNIVLPDNLREIQQDTFSNCGNLRSITIPTNVISIGDCAFHKCTSLPSVDISSNVTNISNFAFMSCTGLTNIEVESENAYFGSIDGVLFNKALTRLIKYPGGKESAYTVPSSVDTISDSAFYNCVNLPAVSIGTSVSSIGYNAFGECFNLVLIDVAEENNCYSSDDGVLFNNEQNMLITFPGGKNGIYSIPFSVTTIGKYAFYRCVGLTEVVIPSTILTIGDGSFCSCQGLSKITIPDSVTNIGDYAFNFCTNLTSVNLSSSLSSIGEGTFSQCYNLSSVAIPDSVVSISEGAFAYCLSLSSLTIGSGVATIEYWSFSECENLSSILFQGNAPEIIDPWAYIDEYGNTISGIWVFENTPASIYYLSNSSGWGETFAGRPTTCWNPTIQQDANFGLSLGQFGFKINGMPNIPIKIEATDNLGSGEWSTAINKTLDGSGNYFFSDPFSSLAPCRFYRIVFP